MAALHVRDLRQLGYRPGTADPVVGGKNDVLRYKFAGKISPGQKSLLRLFFQKAQTAGRLGQIAQPFFYFVPEIHRLVISL